MVRRLGAARITTLDIPAVVVAAGITVAAAAAAAPRPATEVTSVAKALAAAVDHPTSSQAQSSPACGRPGNQTATVSSSSAGTEVSQNVHVHRQGADVQSSCGCSPGTRYGAKLT